jgi:hypothetical protein
LRPVPREADAFELRCHRSQRGGQSRAAMRKSPNRMVGSGGKDEKLLARLVGGAVVLLLLAVVLCPPTKADALADIKALEDRFVAAFKAKDPDAIMKVYVPDQTLFVFDVVPPRQYVGAAAYRKDCRSFSTASTARSPSS